MDAEIEMLRNENNYNLYAYCNNDWINYTDPFGNANRKLNKRYWYQFVFMDKASKDLYDNGRKMTIQYMFDNIKNELYYN